MRIVIVVLSFLLFSLIKVVIRDKLSFICVFCYLSWWLFWLFLSTFDPYDLFPVTTYSYLLLILNVLFFVLGFAISAQRIPPKYPISLKYSFKPLICQSIKFKIILFVFIGIVYYYFHKYLFVLTLYNAAEGRNTMFEEGELFSSHYEILLYNMAVKPFFYFLSVLIAVLLIYFSNKYLLVLSIVFLLLYSYIGSGRGAYITVLMMLGFAFLIKSYVIESPLFYGVKFSTLKKMKIRLYILLVGCTVVLFVSYITALRKGEIGFSFETLAIGFEEFFKQCVWYMTGPFRALDYALDQNYLDKTDLLWGRSTFAGVDALVKIVIHFFGGSYTSAGEITTMFLQENYIPVGNDITMNFAYTCVMAYLFDFGFLGVIICPFLSGFFVRKAFLTFQRYPTFPMFVLCLFLFYAMIMTVFKWSFQFIDVFIFVACMLRWHHYIVRKSKLKYYRII